MGDGYRYDRLNALTLPGPSARPADQEPTAAEWSAFAAGRTVAAELSLGPGQVLPVAVQLSPQITPAGECVWSGKLTVRLDGLPGRPAATATVKVRMNGSKHWERQ